MEQFGIPGQPGWDQIIQAIKDVGFPIVAFLLLLLVVLSLIGWAVAHFIRTLAAMSQRQEFTADRLEDRITAVISEQTRATEKLADAQIAVARELGGLAEATRGVMVFLSHTQQEVVAHRVAVEGPQADVPSPPVKPGEGQS